MKIKSNTGRRKAISGILAGIIFFAMLFTAGLSFILFTFVSYNNYDRAQAAALQAQQAKSAESLVLRSCDSNTNQLPGAQPYGGWKCKGGDTSVWVQNEGGVSTTLVGIWVFNLTAKTFVELPSTPPFPQTTPKLSYTLNTGNVTIIDTGLALSPTGSYSITFISSTGNQFSTSYPPGATGTLTLTTTLSQGVIGFSQSVYDTATLTGISDASGYKVNYYYFGDPATGITDGTCSTARKSAGTVIVSGDNVPASNTNPSGIVSYPIVGTYSWLAELLDLSGNVVATSPCEQLTVTSTTPTITTTLSQAVIPSGGRVYDTAVLSGISDGSGYTVTYSYFGDPTTGVQDGTCATSPHDAGTVSVSGSSVPPSNTNPVGTVPYPNSGTYSWHAELFGPTHNLVATSPCEQLTVGSSNVGLTTSLSPSEAYYFPVDVKDSATVTGIADASNYKVNYYYFNDGACGTPAGGNLINTVTITSGTVAPPSNVHTFAIKGNYSFNAKLYDPSSNFVTASSCEPLLVSNQPISITTSLLPPILTSFPVTVIDTSVLSGISNAAGYTVKYYYFGNPASGVSDGTCSTTPNAAGGGAISLGVSTPASNPVVYKQPGNYSWDAQLFDPSSKLVTTSACEQLQQVSSIASSFGLGFISLDFNSYKAIYTTANCAPDQSGAPPTCTALALTGGFVKGAPLAYTLPTPQNTKVYVLFSMNVTNTDPAGRNIVLDSYSVLDFLKVPPHGGGGFASIGWYLGNITSAGTIVWTFPTSGILIPNHSTVPKGITLYFTVVPGVGSGGWSGYPDPSTIQGVFMYLHGVMGTGCKSLTCSGSTPIGENEPLVSTLFTSRMSMPTITFTSSGKLGSSIPLTGSGFTPSSLLTFSYDGQVLTTSPTSVTSTAAGAIPAGVTFTVPTSSGGAHTVAVVDLAGLVAQAQFTVSPAPTLVITPTSHSHTSSTSIVLSSGSNYANSMTYGYCLSTSSTTVRCVSGTSSTVVSSSTGTITGSPTIYSVQQPTNTYYVLVYDPTTKVIAASATFTET